jgi:molecular chaperone DnaJ
LSDDKQRERYDQFGHAGVDPNFQGHNPFEGFNFNDGSFHFSSGGGGNAEIDPEELFDLFFGSGGSRRRRPRGPRRGADLQMHVKLTFKEAVFGCSKDLNLRYQHISKKSGEVEFKERSVTVDVPPGIDHGMNLRLQGQGAEGDPGAAAGNLLVQILVENDPYFVRDGYDVHTEVPISFVQAVLGGSVDVKTLAGEVEMKVPKGCQPDAKLMLRGKGIQQLNGPGKGNHIVHLKLQIPKDITARQEELLREFDDISQERGCSLSGRIAKAAGSAFEKLFGSGNSSVKKEEDEEEKGSDKKNAKAKKRDKEKSKDDSDYEDEMRSVVQ